jgi:hypothetical protein
MSRRALAPQKPKPTPTTTNLRPDTASVNIPNWKQPLRIAAATKCRSTATRVPHLAPEVRPNSEVITIDQARLRPHLRLTPPSQTFTSPSPGNSQAGNPRQTPPPPSRTPLVGEPAELRGIPVLAAGVGGTQPGTNPLTETLRRLT